MTNKLAFELYPFLRPRDPEGSLIEYTEEELNEAYFTEIPSGWYRLFFQMCAEIEPVLERYNLLYTFYFLQVKEKFNRLICYYNMIAPEEVKAIIEKYEEMAYYVCSNCGMPAEVETKNYFLSYCNDCCKDFVRHEEVNWITFKPHFNINVFENDMLIEKQISFEEEWKRYINYAFGNTMYPLLTTDELCPACGAYSVDGNVCVLCQKEFGLFEPKPAYSEDGD